MKSWKIKQVILGFLMIGICIAIMLLAKNSTLPEDKNIAPVILFGPAGLYLIFTKNRFVD